MGKVVITQEQADLVEQFKRNFKGFGREVLIDCLDGHYEIKPKFKEGDIINDGYGGIREVAEVNEEGMYLYTNYKNTGKAWFGNQTGAYKNMRHATDIEIGMYKERRFWHENDREVWELKKNDIIYINQSIERVRMIAGNSLYTFESPAMYSIDLIKENNNVKVMCFAHDRKDLNND